MTLKADSSRSSTPSRVNVHSNNRKSMGGFLSDLHCVQHCVSHRIRDIWC